MLKECIHRKISKSLENKSTEINKNNSMLNNERDKKAKRRASN